MSENSLAPFSVTFSPSNVKPGDARDLLLQLYREIGISAVAAALNAGKKQQADPVEDIISLQYLRQEIAA